MRKHSSLLALILLLSTPLNLPAATAQPPMQPAIDEIRSFYQAYLDSASHSRAVPDDVFQSGVALFSKVFKDWTQLNRDLCDRVASGEVCGWGSYGDPFLDAQDYGDDLSFASSAFQIQEIPTSAGETKTIEVRFKLMPSEQVDPAWRVIHFMMVVQNQQWVVDDMVYFGEDGSPRSAVESMSKEIGQLRKWYKGQ